VEQVTLEIYSHQSHRRIVLVGNGAYAASPLKNPPNDAYDMAKALSNVGFTVEHSMDLTQRQMKAMIRVLGQKLKSGGQEPAVCAAIVFPDQACGSWHDLCQESVEERFCHAIRVAEAIEPVNMTTRCGILMDFLSLHHASKKLLAQTHLPKPLLGNPLQR
jgi:Caspase domain